MVKQRSFNTIEELMTMITRAGRESPTYQRIALYIEKNYLQIIFLTANELADKMGVSQGSVSRFFMTLGYKGYNGFLRNLQAVVSQQLTAPQRLELSGQQQPVHRQQRQSLVREMRNLDALNAATQGESYERMVAAIASPQPLYLASARMSATLLPYLAYALHKMRDDVHVATPDTPQWERLELGQEQDGNVLIISFPRYATTLLRLCQQLHRRQVPFQAITDSRLSPIVPLADNVVLTPITTSSLFDIYSTPMLFFNLLLQDAARQMPGLEERIAAIEAVERENNVYFTN
jgi:DNA-binding MurR/RpiR family transcriptional regulator